MGDPEDEEGDGNGNDHGRAERDDEETTGFSFSLPPVSVPPMFPTDFEWRVPRPGVRAARAGFAGLLVGAAILDTADAALALAGPAWLHVPRAVVVTAVAVVLVGRAGALAAWEVVAAAVAPPVAAAPTLVSLVVLVGRRHPEEFDGGTDGEGEPPDEQE